MNYNDEENLLEINLSNVCWKRRIIPFGSLADRMLTYGACLL